MLRGSAVLILLEGEMFRTWFLEPEWAGWEVIALSVAAQFLSNGYYGTATIIVVVWAAADALLERGR